MSHANEPVTIDAALHADLKTVASKHPAAGIATSPLAKALTGDTTIGGSIANHTLTAYLSAIESGPVPGVTDSDRQALIARANAAFPGR